MRGRAVVGSSVALLLLLLVVVVVMVIFHPSFPPYENTESSNPGFRFSFDSAFPLS
jgi:hypothetical protein